jgi:hypothetical protein
MVWVFLTFYKSPWASLQKKSLYVLIKHSGYYKSLGFRIPFENKKLVSYNVLNNVLKDCLNSGINNNLFHISQIPIETIIDDNKNKRDFMYFNKILMPYENIVFYKRLHLNIRRKRFIISTSDLLIEEFKKDY